MNWRSRLPLYLTIYAALASGAEAKERAILLNRSRSPDGQKEMVVVDSSPRHNGGAAIGVVSIRDIKTRRTLCSFDYYGFGEHPDADTFEAIIWRPDSKAVAVASEATRGFVECKVYLLAKGEARQVKLPDFGALLQKRCRGELSIKGHETPVRWLDHDQLLLSIGNRACEKEFKVTLRIDQPRHSKPPTATIAAIEEGPPAD